MVVLKLWRGGVLQRPEREDTQYRVLSLLAHLKLDGWTDRKTKNGDVYRQIEDSNGHEESRIIQGSVCVANLDAPVIVNWPQLEDLPLCSHVSLLLPI